MKKAIFIVTLAVSIGLFPSLLLGAVWYVDIDNASTQDGTGWLTAFTTIQAGIDAAFADGGGEVWVAEGSYPEAIIISSNVMLYGGFAGDETQLSERNIDTYPCIVNAGTADDGNPAQHVVVMDNIVNAGIDGFTITGGVADSSNGGGVYAYYLNETVTISNCVIIGNTATRGGGIYLYNSSINLHECTIANNVSSYYGGGLFISSGAPELKNCIVSGNTGGTAGGGYLTNTSAILHNCTISGNSASGSTSGIYLNGGAPVIANCNISSNVSTTGGGISYINGSASIFNTIFNNNTPYGVYSGTATGPVLEHCLFYGNDLADFMAYFYDSSAGQNITRLYTGAIEIDLSVPQAASNCDGDPSFVSGPEGVWTQAPVYDSEADRTTLTDASAAFGNDVLVGYLINTDTTQYRQALIVAHTDTTIQIAGDVTAFTATDAAYSVIDYHLSDGSPAIDRGDPANAPNEDFEGDTRPGTDGLIDIGVDESDAAYVPPEDNSPPVSMVHAIPDTLTVASCTIPFSAADAESGIKHVQLYFSKDGGDWTAYNGTYTESPVTFDSSTQGGDGLYEFYTIATDNADNVEAPPETPDAFVKFITAYAGTRIYVDQSATGQASGLDWDNAFSKINTAITVAEGFGVPEVWVAEGIYAEAIVLISNLDMYGGFDGVETQLLERNIHVHPTTIDASTANGGAPAKHAVQIVGVVNARLDGFSITGGIADSSYGVDSYGGGLYASNLDASVSVSKCKIIGNTARAGGGVYVNNSTLAIEKCIISNNTALSSGGGLHFYYGAPNLTGCVISGNTSNTGGGGYLQYASATLKNCTISGNTASGSTPGMAISGGSPVIANCTISENGGATQGGSILDAAGTASIFNTIFHNNTPYAIYSGSEAGPVVTHCLFNENELGDYALIIYDYNTGQTTTDIYTGGNQINLYLPQAENNYDGDPLFVSSITGTWSGAPVFDSAANRTTLTDASGSFVADFLVGQLINTDSSQDRQALIVANTSTTIEVVGDVTTFAAAGADYRIIDYNLSEGSSAIDRGDPANAPVEDFEGDPRPGSDGLVDIGVDETDAAYEAPDDTNPPLSMAQEIPDISTVATCTISFLAADAESGIKHVELYFRKDGGDWQTYNGPYTESPIAFDSATQGGDGFYEFYTLATDNADNLETPPDTPDTSVSFITSYAGSRIYVDQNATGLATGLDWDNAFLNLNAAFIIAEGFGVPEIWVAEGTYEAAIVMTSNLAIYGGFEGVETQPNQRDIAAHPTVIDASLADGGTPAEHVVTMVDIVNARLDGFAITGGNAQGSNDGSQGGGIFCDLLDASNFIANCVVKENSANSTGGGIYVRNASPQIIDCEIRQNTSEWGNGGGIGGTNASPIISGCNITNNQGGGLYFYNNGAPIIDDCQIAGNLNTYGASFSSLDNFTLSRSTIAGNGRSGGYTGLYVAQTSGTINRCVVSGNLDGGIGGYSYNGLVIENSIISGNAAAGMSLSGNFTIFNCTFHSNDSGLSLNGEPLIVNSIFADNDDYGIYESYAYGYTPTLRANLFYGNLDGDYYDADTDIVHYEANSINLELTGAERNVSGDPLFTIGPQGTWTGIVYDYSSARTTFTDENANFEVGALVGSLINPDTNEYRQAFIVANTATTIEVLGNFTSMVSEGEAYRVIDYHIQNGSAALDRGESTDAPTEDMEGDTRPGDDSLTDIGADEADPAFEPPADTIEPISRVAQIPDVITQSIIEIAFDSSDAQSGIEYVELFYRKDGGDWVQYGGQFTSSPILFDTSITGGSGYYEFYTIATDNSGNSEPAKTVQEDFVYIIPTFSGDRAYVDGNTTEYGNGESWASPVKSINAGLILARIFGLSEVWVAQGTYLEAIELPGGVSLYGGFGGTEAALDERDITTNPTIIDAATADYGRPATHVVLIENVTDVRLDGFTLTGGQADGGTFWGDDSGGGILVNESEGAIVIANCVITGNYGDGGGGIYVYTESGTLDMINCIIEDNTAEYAGGAYFDNTFINLSDSVIRNNAAPYEAGGIEMYYATGVISDCEISDNTTEGEGGGIYIDNVDYNQAAPQLINCIISNNTAYEGGGLYGEDLGVVEIDRCSITGNRSLDVGGGLYFNYECDPQITDSLITGNQADSEGGGLYVRYYVNFIVENTIISGNDGGEYGGGMYAYRQNTYQQSHEPILINSIVSGNRADYGGGIYFDDISPLIINSTISSNEAIEGGGLYLYRGQPDITNTIIEGNTGNAVVESYSSGDVFLSYCLFYNNADGDYYDYDTSTLLTGADDINALTEAESVMDGDPAFEVGLAGTWTSASVFDDDANITRLFADGAAWAENELVDTLLNPNTAQMRQAWIVSNTATTIDVWGDITAFVESGDAFQMIDYHLQDSSACIDTGTDTNAPNVDLEGFYRPVDLPGVGQDATGTEYDLGVYEYQKLDDLFLLPTSPGFVTAGHEGQTFAPAQFSITLQNIGPASLNWSVAWVETWLAVTPASGSLAPDQSQEVTVTITPASADLPVGIHSSTLTFINTSTAVEQQRTVEIRVRRNYFTEIFTNSDNDIDYQTLTLTPDGSEHFYSLCRTPATTFPTDPDGGTLINFANHNYYRGISLEESKQVPAYGIAYDAIVVYANGYITYGGYTYNATQESLEQHFSHPHVSALFDDLDPTVYGRVSWKQLEDRVAVTYENVPEYGGSGSNSFQVELFFDGVITITHLEIDAADGLVGLSEGLGVPEDFIESDLSEYACAQGAVTFLSEFYTYPDQIDLELADADLSGTGTQVLTVTSTSGDSEEVMLAETSSSQGGIFTGGLASVSGSAVSGNGFLELSDGDTISVTYHDADAGSGNPADVTSTAYIDSQPVSVSNVSVTGIGSFQVTVTFETDEPATATVYYGPDAGDPDSSLISGTMVQTSHMVVLPGLLHDTPYFFEVQATDVAGNMTTDDNGGMYYTFNTLSLPNLVTSDVSAPTEAASGQTISVTWTVTNMGDEAAVGSWSDGIYFSYDDQPGNDTYLVATTRPTELIVGNSYQLTRNANLPDVEAGIYWIVVTADRGSAISELDEGDNAVVFGPITIGQPNLVISDLTAPDQTYAGANITVGWTVTNSGADDASGSWYDIVYLSENEQLSGSYWYLGNYNRLTELAPAEFYERSVQVAIPSYAAGDYYIIVRTDNNDYVNETNESDNQIVHGPIVVGQPNLTLSDVVVPSVLSTGRPADFTWIVTNTSSVPVTVNWTDRVYLSTDDQFGEDLNLGGIDRPNSLGPGEHYLSSTSISIPGTAAGDYWIIVRADSNNSIGESDEDDNTIITGPITVTGPDLIVASIQAPTDIYVGESISIDWTVENIGGAEALGSWDDTIYLSDDDQVGDDQGLYTDSRLSELDAGASYNASYQLAVPGVAAGTYWLVVVTDRWGSNAEIDEGNNTAIFGPITIRRPNLTTTNVQIPAEMWTRQDYNLSWTVTNNGTVPTVRTWRDAVYLSTDDQIGDDTLLDEIDCPAVLTAGQQYDRALTVTVSEIASGDYWILIRSDNNGVIPETDEGDNVFAAGPIPVRTTPYANLQVSQAEFAVSEVDIGQQFTVDWEVVNVGIGPTSASFWKDRIYVSVDESLDITDTKIGERGNVSYLNSGENYTSTTVVTIGGTSEADYYILVKTDATDEVYEYQAEDDNVFVAGQVHVSIPPPADFIVTSVVAPALAFSGQPFAMTYQVLNVGVDVGDSASWYDDVYLSEDTVLDTNADQRIARILRIASSSRNPDPPYNVEYTANINAVPPVGLSGTFYVFVDTDATNRINEWAFENNNTAYDDSPIEITLTPPPDLEIVDIIPPIDATAGRSFTLSYSVRNSGSTRTPNDRWTDAFYLSSDATLDVQNDVLLVRRTVTFYGDPGGLDVDQTYTRDETLTAPVDTPTGDYTLFVVTDYYDQVFELDNANNSSHAVIPIESRPADLVVDAITGNADAEAGKAFTLRWTVRNQGPGDSITTTWYDRIAVTQNDIIGDGDDISLREFRHDGRLYPNQSYPATGTVTIPFSLSGDYFVYVRTDSRGHVFEGANGNANNVSDLHPITIARFIPDLSATAASATIENGRIDVQWTVENIGENRTNTNYWRDAIVASANDTYGDGDDLQLFSAAHSGYLEATAIYTSAQTIVLPTSITDDVYLFVEANHRRHVDEGGLYGNNVIQAGMLTAADIQAMRTTPDFIVESVSAPLDAIAGQTFEIDWTVHNVGEFLPQQAPFPPEAAKGVWVDRLYLSRDTFLDPAEDIYIGQEIVYAGELVDVTDGDSPYQAYSKSTSLRIPEGMTGPFYVIVNTDRSNLVAEPGGEDNNIGYDSQAMLVTLAPVVDLVVGTITIPANVSVGSRLTIDYTLENQSDSDVTGDWSDLYYLSTDAAIDFDDVELGTNHRFAEWYPLPAHGSTDISTYFNLPGVMPGDYYVILRTDAFNQIRESDELNNFGISQSMVSIDMPSLATDYPDGRAPVETELTWLNGGRASFYYKLEVGGGSGLTLIPEWLLSDGQNRHTQVSAYVAKNRIPTLEDYDHVETHWLISGSAGEISTAPLTLTGLDAGTYYIMLSLQGLGIQEFETRPERFDLLIDPVQTVTEIAVEIDVELNKQQVKGYYCSFDTVADKTLMLSPYWLYLNRQTSHQDNILYDRLALTKIFVAFNRIATPYDYDFIDDRFLRSNGYAQPTGDSPLIIPKSKEGRYYVYVEIHDAHSPWSTPYINGLKAIEYTQERFNVILSELPFTLLAVEPDSVGNAGKATLELIASNLDLCSTIELVQNDQVVKNAEDIFIPDPEVPKAYVRFDLEGLPRDHMRSGSRTVPVP